MENYHLNKSKKGNPSLDQTNVDPVDLALHSGTLMTLTVSGVTTTSNGIDPIVLMDSPAITGMLSYNLLAFIGYT